MKSLEYKGKIVTKVKRIYDWQKLKNQFIGGNCLTLADFFCDQGIKNNSRSRLNARGWLGERRNYREDIARQALNKVKEDEIDVRRRHQKIANQLQLKGLKELQNLMIRNSDDARKLLVDGMREEREALGINGQRTNNSNLTQVNISLPKTHFDEVLEKADYQELLGLIAIIRKEKAGRSDKTVTT
jgi:hypothetical protein